MTVGWIRLVTWVDAAHQLWLFECDQPNGTSRFVFRAIVFGDDEQRVRDFIDEDDGRTWLEAAASTAALPASS